LQKYLLQVGGSRAGQPTGSRALFGFARCTLCTQAFRRPHIRTLLAQDQHSGLFSEKITSKTRKQAARVRDVDQSCCSNSVKSSMEALQSTAGSMSLSDLMV